MKEEHGLGLNPTGGAVAEKLVTSLRHFGSGFAVLWHVGVSHIPIRAAPRAVDFHGAIDRQHPGRSRRAGFHRAARRAIVFVIAVGLGPAAGVLALMIDTIGFAARFFAEAMEETDKGTREALTAMGASRSGIIFSAVVPQALPSMINTSLFSLEKATRGSVVLGLVGAGGIGIELKVSLELFDYDQAATTIIALDQSIAEGKVNRGDLVELIAFGAGLTWGAAVLRW